MRITEKLLQPHSSFTALSMLFALTLAGPAEATSGYVGLSGGQTTVQVESNDICPFFGDIQCNIDDSDSGFKLFGGAKLSKNFAVEGGIADLGEVTMTGFDSFFGNTRTSTEAFVAFGSVLGIIPVGSDFALFGKLGVHLWSAEWSLASSLGSLSDEADGTGFLFGFGGSVSFGDRVEVRGEWERFADIGDLASTDEGDWDLLSLGVVLNF
jgi:OOP family OmpA-OmpF porin